MIFTQGCSADPEQAHRDYEEIRANGTGRSTVLAQHFIVSFKPGEITPERALQLGQEICEQFLKGEYQYFMACHIDKEHTHLHCVFNNTNCIDGRTFETHENRRTTKQDRSFQKLMNITDEVCKRHHLYVIERPEMGKGKSHWEWDMTRQGLSWKDKLKYMIDQVVKVSENFDDFLAKCADFGVLVEYNPDHKIDLKFMLAEQRERNPRARFTRARTLGWFYETEQIKKRIAQYIGAMVYVPRIKVKVITPKAEENKFIRDAIDRENMKLTSIAINTLSKYGLTVDQANDAAIAAFNERMNVVSRLNKLNSEIEKREEQLYWLTHYLDTKPMHEKYMSLKGKKQKKYGDQFDADLYRYSVWEQKLKEAFPKKFPTVEQLEKYIQKLRTEMNEKNAEYTALDKKARELSQAAKEIETYLAQEQSRGQVQSREQEQHNTQQKKRKRNDIEL